MKINKYVLIFIGISIFLAAYLYYVDYNRKQSIAKYFDNPKVGDIYKIKKDEGDGKWVAYYKVHSFQDNKIAFVPGKLKSDASADYLLKQFNEYDAVIYTREELKEIRAGKWNNFQKDYTVLVEIVRK